MDTRTEILTEIKALAGHYPRRQMATDDLARWFADYAEDLDGFTPSEVSQACRGWRQSEAGTKFPAPGQLIAACRQVRSQAVHAPDPAPRSGPYEPWKLSSADVADMSLLEALRYRLAMAAHCRAMAGPMWRNGRPATLEEMPERWHGWRRQAEDHEAEAHRLRARLADSQA